MVLNQVMVRCIAVSRLESVDWRVDYVLSSSLLKVSVVFELAQHVASVPNYCAAVHLAIYCVCILTLPRSLLCVVCIMRLHLGHMTLLGAKFQPHKLSPQLDLHHQVASRWALPPIFFLNCALHVYFDNNSNANNWCCYCRKWPSHLFSCDLASKTLTLKPLIMLPSRSLSTNSGFSCTVCYWAAGVCIRTLSSHCLVIFWRENSCEGPTFLRFKCSTEDFQVTTISCLRAGHVKTGLNVVCFFCFWRESANHSEMNYILSEMVNVM